MKLLDVTENVNKKVKEIEGEELERLKAYPQDKFNRVMNPMAWPIEAGCNGQWYRIKGFSMGKLETYDIYHVNHILQSAKDMGLVSIEYGKLARKEYPDFEQYLKVKELEGLNKALKFWTEVLEGQKTAVTERKEVGGIDYVRAQEKQKEFQEMVDSIKDWIKQAGAEVIEHKQEKISLSRPKPVIKKTKEVTINK